MTYTIVLLWVLVGTVLQTPDIYVKNMNWLRWLDVVAEIVLWPLFLFRNRVRVVQDTSMFEAHARVKELEFYILTIVIAGTLRTFESV